MAKSEFAALGLSIMSLTSCTVQARVQDYQILRLLSDKTACNTEHIEAALVVKGGFAFHATCQNVTFYPDGLDIICTDGEDDRTCRILGEKLNFKTLDLLRQQ